MQFKRFEGHGLRILKAGAITMLYIHWTACAHFFVPGIVYFNQTSDEISSKSWTKKGNLPTKDPWTQYSHSVLRTIANLCSVGYGQESEALEDVIMSILNQLTGFMVLAYLTGKNYHHVEK